MSNSFSRSATVTLLVLAAIAAIGVGLVGMAAAQSSDLDTIENSTIETTNETEYVELDIQFADSFNDTSEETVEFNAYNESAWQDDGEEVGNYSETLNGTILTIDDTVHTPATYSAELDSSATTVTFNGSDVASDGTVDLADHTSDSLTSDDTVLSLTLTADTVVSDTVTGGPSDTVNVHYTLNETEFAANETYRVFVEAGDENHIASGYVSPDDATIGGGFFDGDDSQPGFGATIAVAAIAAAAGVARFRGGS